MALHSKHGASSAYRWIECPGSIQLSAGVEDDSSYYAKEGTAAHDLAATALKDQCDAVDYIGTSWAGGDTHFLAGDEMIEAVQVYLDAINGDAMPGDELYVEHKFTLEQVYKGMFGTSDAVRLQPRQRLLRVYDFKYGAGIAVEAERNEQMQYYGLGAALSFKGFDEVELVIVQPRAIHAAGPVRRWRLSILDLLEFQDDLRQAAIRTEAPDAPLKAGDHCRFCPAKGFCPELRGAGERAAMVEFTEAGTNTPAAPNFLTPDQINRILRDADITEIWINAVREYAHGVLTSGQPVTGWKLVQKRANRVWADEMEAAMTLHALGVPEEKIYVKKMVSPAAGEKLLPKKVRTELSALIRPGVSSGTTLARVEDPRPALVGGAEHEFAPVAEQ